MANNIPSPYTGGGGSAGGSPSEWKNVVTQYGADNTGVADATTAIQNAVNAVVGTTAGGTVYLPAGIYKVASTITVVIPVGDNNSGNITEGQSVNIRGAGRGATILAFSGSGDCLRMYGTNYPFYSSVTGLTIDGTSAGAGSAGLHLGDIFQCELDLATVNFSGAGSIGCHLDNNYFWTEQLHGRIFADNCAQMVVFDNSVNTSGSATGSFDRANLVIGVDDHGGQDCVVLKNGANISDGFVGIYGNANKTTAANTAAVLRFGNGSEMINSTLNIGVELDGALANAPHTIIFGTTVSGSGIVNCSGLIDYAVNATFATSNIATQGTFTFYGQVYGDTTLVPQTIQATLTTLGDLLYENATPAPARLAGNTTATKKFLTQTGTGSVSAVPGWNTIVAGDVPSTLNATTFSGNVTGQDGVLFSAHRTVTAATSSISTSTDFLVLCDTTSNNVTLTLPDATTCAGQLFSMVCIEDSNSVIVNTTSSQTVGGKASGVWQLAVVGNAITVQSDGANWQLHGTAGVADALTLLGGSDTQPAVAAAGGVTTPALTSTVAAQINNTFDVMLYCNIKIASTFQLAIGPTSTPANTIVASATAAIGLITTRIPANWWVKATFTAADVVWTAIVC